jgi:Holliday junction resolvase
MTNKPKAKGTKWETDVVNYLRDQGFVAVERRVLSGSKDKGDIAGIPNTVLECKGADKYTLGPWLKEAAKEAENAGVTRYAVIAKQRQKPTAEGFAIMPLWLFTELIRDG